MTVPSWSIMTICPNSTRRRSKRTVLREKFTKGLQVKDPAYPRNASNVGVMADVIAIVVCKLHSTVIRSKTSHTHSSDDTMNGLW